MAERIIVTKPFETIADATNFFEVFTRQMQALGYSIESAQSSGGIGTDAIGINVDQPGTGENLGNVRLVIGKQMILEAAGNIFAYRNIVAVALGLGLHPSDALELAASAKFNETKCGGPVLAVVVPNLDNAE